MILSYIYPETLPNSKARAISVLYTAKSLSNLCTTNLFCEYGSDCHSITINSSLNCIKISRKKCMIRSNKFFNLNLSKNEPFHKTDIFYIRHLKTANYLLHNRSKKSKIIFECHEVFHHSNPKIEAMERQVIENVDGLVFINRTLQKIFNQTFKISHISQKVIDNGCGFELEYLDKDYSRLDTMVYIGSFQPWKGVDFLIEAMAHLPGMRLQIVGDGEQKEHLQRRVKDLDLVKRINFLGYRNHNEIIEILRKPILAVIPNTISPFNRFSTPIKLYEYMAASCVIAAADMPTIQEIITDGKNGFLFETGNMESFVETIKRIHNIEPLPLQRIAKQAYEDSKKYTWDARAKKICDFSKQLMGQ